MLRPKRVYDLSQPVFANCPQYADPNPRPVVVRLLYTQAAFDVTKEIVELSTHSGTHCDAPLHFFEGGTPVDEVPLSHYIAPAVVADVRHKEPGTAIEPDDLRALEDRIEPGDVVLLNTGFGKRRANTKRFLTEYVWLSGPAASVTPAEDTTPWSPGVTSLSRYGGAPPALATKSLAEANT